MQFIVSDLHLCPQHPHTAAAFLQFLAGPARKAEKLWILGDLFEYWIGDDEDEPFNAEICAALKTLSERKVAIHFIAGNRDFLIGQAFAQRCGVHIENEPVLLQLAGQSTLLLHGDIVCTDDHAYQAFRQMVRERTWQAQFLAQPIAVRHQIAAKARGQSEQSKQEKTASIMDVNPQAVVDLFRQYGAQRIIHGHTHRPARHLHQVDGKLCERWVLSDWHGTATGLQIAEKQICAF